jgi:hypothetical protein
MWKIGLIVAMAAFLALALLLDPLRNYFALVDPPSGMIVMMGVVVAATGALLPAVWKLGDRAVGWFERRIARRGDAAS